MRMLIAIFLGLSIVGCTSALVCNDLEKPAITYVANNVVMNLCTCTDATQVSTWVQSKVPSEVQSLLCPASGSKPKGAIGSAICAPFINAIAQVGCTQIPSCTGPNPSSTAVSALITKCSGAF